MKLTEMVLKPAPPKSATPLAPAQEPVLEVGGDHFTLSQGIRYAKDFGSLLSDAKTVATVAGNLVTLPPGLNKLLGPTNGIGLAGGVVSLGFDAYGAYKTFQDPTSTHQDKVVDIAHIAVSDVLATAAGSLPLFTSIHNPVTMSIYVAGQAAGVGFDIYKTIYDLKKHAQAQAQSG
jgi:hypothetical protein